MKKILLFSLIILQSLMGCKETKNETVTSDNEKGISQSSTIQSFDWESATVYFLLTDRFNNGDPSNDLNFERGEETGYLRGFEGGDLKGVTQKISEGYFNDLGVNAIWMTPVVEQIHGATDEGTGLTYGYHGYWTKDWTAID
ncbi:MAG: alpha-amylase, partial [Bacteroidia bacterium]|nr:alpha-amylase [Bacteroidia bacterium]